MSYDFLISIICFPLAPNNLSIFLFTEFAFLFEVSYLFFSLLFLREMRGIKMVTAYEENRDWRAEELRSCSLFFILSLVFPFSSFSWNHCLYFTLSLCSLYLWSFTELSPVSKTTSIRGTGSVVQISTITNHRSGSVQKFLWCYSILSEWISAFVHSRQDEKTKCHNSKRKTYSSWWQALDFFAGVAILMRFAAKSIHINVKGVHTRPRWTFDWNKEREI